MSFIEEVASAHTKAALAAIDFAADELIDSLNDADQCGAFDVPAHRRDAEQDEAVTASRGRKRPWRSIWGASLLNGTASTPMWLWRCCDE